eukprot:273400-Pleurochrysis_carterae.AAC.1
MPLASVTTDTTPSSPDAGKTALGASGTPSFVATRSAATSSISSSQSRAAAPPGRSGAQSSPLRQPPAAPPREGCATAYPPRRDAFSSGSACAMLDRRPTSDLALRQCTLARVVTSSRISATAARMSAFLFSGILSAPRPASRLNPSATAGSPTTTFAGAACSPNSARPSTAS